MFIGAAAIATGLFTLLFGLGIAPQLALVRALRGARGAWSAAASTPTATADSADPLLNDRAARLVGKMVTVVEAVDEHGGRVRVGDGEWSARGGPAAAGERVRITGVDGNCLKVEAERALPPA